MKVIIFDLDGTLLDTAKDMMSAANLAFAQEGYGAQLDLSHRAIAVQGGRQMLRQLFAMENEPFDDESLMVLYRKFIGHYRRNICTHTEFYPGALGALSWCRDQGYGVALCTNKPGHLTELLLPSLGIERLFDVVVTPDSLGIAKPKAEPLLHAIGQAGCAVDQAVMVGDTITDVSAARNAGCKVLAVALDQPRNEVEKLRPDAIIEHFSEFPRAVASLLAAGGV